MFYAIDKPLWLSSYDVIRRLKKILWERRIGHTGTLDPLATGYLLIATGNSTKLIPYLEKAEKRYAFSVDISRSTPSLDLATEPVNTLPIQYHKTREELEAFLLDQTCQTPPIYSALHIGGKRAYEYAREGLVIEMKERPIEIKNVSITRFEPPYFDLELTISSGGYIRSLAPVIWEFFGTGGWCITALRRTQIGELGHVSSEYCQDLEVFDIQKSLPYSLLFPHWKERDISHEEYIDLKNGKSIPSKQEEENWQKIILRFEDKYSSLVESFDNRYRVIKNDIWSSQ